MSWSDPEGYTTGGIMLCKLGSYDLALHALAKAVDGGYTVVEPLLHDPWLAPLRDNPRFTEILRRAQARRDEALAVFRAEGGERAARAALGGLTPGAREFLIRRRAQACGVENSSNRLSVSDRNKEPLS